VTHTHIGASFFTRFEYNSDRAHSAGICYCSQVGKFREGGSDKYLRDIRAMLHVSAELINHSELNHWIQRLVVEAEWNKVQEKK
jgi:hypothetical protein